MMFILLSSFLEDISLLEAHARHAWPADRMISFANNGRKEESPELQANSVLRLVTRLSIVAYETVGLGAFVILLGFLENREAMGNAVMLNFSWVFWLVGVVIIVVGLESASLVRQIPKDF